jgi:hypothetical protein
MVWPGCFSNTSEPFLVYNKERKPNPHSDSGLNNTPRLSFAYISFKDGLLGKLFGDHKMTDNAGRHDCYDQPGGGITFLRIKAPIFSIPW